jgi:DNA-binding transcriptional LysR family regulator
VFEHYYYTLEAASAGLGICIAPWHLVVSEIQSGRLIAPFGFVRSGRRYCLVHPAELAQAGKVRTFRRWIEKAARARS